jgi:hypothetical protein
VVGHRRRLRGGGVARRRGRRRSHGRAEGAGVPVVH